MKVFALWYGGANYLAPTLQDVEVFESLKEALEALESRAAGCDRYYPGVEDSHLQIFHEDPRSEPEDVYPDRMYTVGRNGRAREI